MQHALVDNQALVSAMFLSAAPIDLTRRSLVARAEVAPRLSLAKPMLNPRPRACNSSRVNAHLKTHTHLGVAFGVERHH